jgi:preprotein translocase subunit SecB
MSNDKQNRYENHPIQLRSLKVLELSIKVIPEHVQLEPNVENFSLFHGHSEYDSKDKSIAVRIGIEMDQDELPFELRVEILGIFEVDEDQFPLKFINNWAEKNAPLILYPYLREHVFSLSTRAGFGGTLLPLFQMPTFYSK